MAPTQTFATMLLSVVLLFLQGTYAARDVEARSDDLVCNKEEGECSYPQSCQCNGQTQLGEQWVNRYYYDQQSETCLENGYDGNCNGFSTITECEQECVHRRP
ncbi:R.appendiculatus Kunitz/BPTI-like protein [Dermacentor variabilis]|uniref:R.appendiculatus Kunitz/BPTI-like protein n=1 Tax=Dermacentor variabilis TaxID=34621 RepID=UPI003F5C2F82